MKLPADLKKLSDKLVHSDALKFNEKDEFGIVFDFNTLTSRQKAEFVGHFDGSDLSKDFIDIIDPTGKMRTDVIPFVMWEPDGLAGPEIIAEMQVAKKMKTLAYAKDGEYPQFNEMWFLHKDGSVSSVEIDGTFIPTRKSKRVVKNYKDLKLRILAPSDFSTYNKESAGAPTNEVSVSNLAKLIGEKETSPALKKILTTLGGSLTQVKDNSKKGMYKAYETEYSLALPRAGVTFGFFRAGDSPKSPLKLEQINFSSSFKGELVEGLTFADSRTLARTKMGKKRYNSSTKSDCVIVPRVSCQVFYNPTGSRITSVSIGVER